MVKNESSLKSDSDRDEDEEEDELLFRLSIELRFDPGDLLAAVEFDLDSSLPIADDLLLSSWLFEPGLGGCCCC